MVIVVYPLESVTELTPDPVKLSPVIPVPISAPLKYVLIADPPPVPPVIVIVVSPFESVTELTPEPVKLSPVAPAVTPTPLK